MCPAGQTWGLEMAERKAMLGPVEQGQWQDISEGCIVSNVGRLIGFDLYGYPSVFSD